MSRLSKFAGEPLIKNINGEEVEFKPLGMKDLSLLMDLGNKDKQAEATTKLISKYLIACFPDSTPEERDNFGIKYFKDFMETIIKVNGLDELKGQSLEQKG